MTKLYLNSSIHRANSKIDYNDSRSKLILLGSKKVVTWWPAGTKRAAHWLCRRRKSVLRLSNSGIHILACPTRLEEWPEGRSSDWLAGRN